MSAGGSDGREQSAWAVALPAAFARAAARLRLRSDVRACLAAAPGASASAASGGEALLWLSGERLDPRLERALRALPGTRYRVDALGRLTPWGRRAPVGLLPRAAPWQALGALLHPEASPAARRPGSDPTLAAPRLAPSARERPAAYLAVEVPAFLAWRRSVPAGRLRGLSFAASDDGRALVRGGALPPLAGARAYDDAGVAVPLGFELEPAVSAALLREALGAARDEVIALALTAGGGWAAERIPGAAFVPADRGPPP